MRPDTKYAIFLKFKGDASSFLPKKRWIKTSFYDGLKVLLSINI